jgi:hypothetical protein
MKEGARGCRKRGELEARGKRHDLTLGTSRAERFAGLHPNCAPAVSNVGM